MRSYAQPEQAFWHSTTSYDGLYNWPGNYYISPPALSAASSSHGQWPVTFANNPIMQPQNMQSSPYLTSTSNFNIAVPYNKPLQYVNPHHAYYARQLPPSWLMHQSYGPGPQHKTASGFDTSLPHFSNSQPVMYNKWPQGPPQKPKQSGHAVWVGNLPHLTDISHLKDHFSLDARDEIESVRLLSQTNCAFINFSSQRACLDAVRRHDRQEFRGYRLVCRFRGSNIPQNHLTELKPGLDDGSVSKSLTLDTQPLTRLPIDTPPAKVPAKYFILKSLTVGDLEASVRNGTWNPQLHHQDTLNEAFETSDTVWLVFSVNKSREFFGVARMCSLCRPSSSENSFTMPNGAGSVQHRSSTTAFVSQQSRTPTVRNASAPPGVVIEDRARKTIFWERQDESPTDGGPAASKDGAAERAFLQMTIMSPTTISAFKVDWISLQRLPFKRTRGLRNAYNDGQIIQVARDGTPVDPISGAKIVALFNAGLPATNVNTACLPQASSHASTSTTTTTDSDSEASSDDTAYSSQRVSPHTMEQMVGKMTLAESPVVHDTAELMVWSGREA